MRLLIACLCNSKRKNMQNNTSQVHLSKKEQSGKIPGGWKILVDAG